MNSENVSITASERKAGGDDGTPIESVQDIPWRKFIHVSGTRDGKPVYEFGQPTGKATSDRVQYHPMDGNGNISQDSRQISQQDLEPEFGTIEPKIRVFAADNIGQDIVTRREKKLQEEKVKRQERNF